MQGSRLNNSLIACPKKQLNTICWHTCPNQRLHITPPMKRHFGLFTVWRKHNWIMLQWIPGMRKSGFTFVKLYWPMRYWDKKYMYMVLKIIYSNKTYSPYCSNLIEDRLHVMTFEKTHIADNYSNGYRQLAPGNGCRSPMWSGSAHCPVAYWPAQAVAVLPYIKQA